MTDQEINQAIAEACGAADRYLIRKRGLFYRPDAAGYTDNVSEAWKLPLHKAKEYEYLRGDEPVTLSQAPVPDYCNDLNAMHQAEAFIAGMDDGLHAGCARYVYARHLYSLVPNDQQPIMATARQRAEAFLRTIGKWRDE